MSAPSPPLHQTYADAVPALSVDWRAETFPDPRLLHLNEDLAIELGFDPPWLRGPEGLALLTGSCVPRTTAQSYSGHQFGSPNPQLGDGRALLLGDLIDTEGNRRDLHLKGSGRTPFSRSGDGRAPLGPMLRELVIGEALHALGIPTTRALAVITTGEEVHRQRGAEPGAMLVRTAASHLRVGTFQRAAWAEDEDVLRALRDHAIMRHHPDAADAQDPTLALLEGVMGRQAELVASWMAIGFVHGVMNTDNMTISGEAIDFGPCAYLDAHRPDAVFSSIDRNGRYAYGNQPSIALWNLSRFAEALLPLVQASSPDAAVEAATAVLEGFAPAYEAAWTRRMAEKMGIPGSALGEGAAEVMALAADGLAVLADQHVDHTGFFRALAEDGGREDRGREGGGRGGSPEVDGGRAHRVRELFSAPDAFDAWAARREAIIASAPGADAATARDRMLQVNPVYIPRNHRLDGALLAAEEGDLGPVERLLEAVRSPTDRRPGLEDLETSGGPEEFLTFCGT